jgi:hypothetical protein
MGPFGRTCCAISVLAGMALGCNGLATWGERSSGSSDSDEPGDTPTRPVSPPTDVGVPTPAPLDSCADGVRNGSEADVDCGGSCFPCADGRLCNGIDDCASRNCVASVCQAPSCYDGVLNGFETGVDCGGDCGLGTCPGEFDVCDCAQSDVLQALSCGWNPANWIHSTPAGDTIVYSVNTHTYRWTRAGGVELLMAQSDAIGMSDDAQTALLSRLGSDGLLIWRANEPSDVLSSMTGADMSADGSIVLAWDYSSTPHSVLWSRERGVIGITESGNASVAAALSSWRETAVPSSACVKRPLPAPSRCSGRNEMG